jgi:DNA-binding response OmpR family regulator/tetratricopeptide (TPR) repeat protein
VSKQSLLLVDGDPRSLRVLEVSLKKAGFNVTTAVNGHDALEQVELAAPDLVIAETVLDEIDGFGFCQRLKQNPAWADIPFVFLTAQTDIESKIKGLELGVDDYLTKPIYIKEIVARARILLQKRQRTRIEERRDGRTRFAGRLSDMPVVDLIQTVEISRKSGLIAFTGEAGKQAAIYFRDGKVIDAEAGPLQAEDAVYRLLTWNEGEFEVVFRTVRRRDAITVSSQALLMEGMRRLDEWGRLSEQLPSLDTRFEVDAKELAARLGDIPDEHNAILRLFDTRRSVMQVIDASDFGDLECLEVIAKLYFEGLLLELGPAKESATSEWTMPSSALEETPGQDHDVAVSGEDEIGDAYDDHRHDVRDDFTGDRQVPGASTDASTDEEDPFAGLDSFEPPSLGIGTPAPSSATPVPPSEAALADLTQDPPPAASGLAAALAAVQDPGPPKRKSLVEKAIDESDLIGLGDIDAILNSGPANTLPGDLPAEAAAGNGSSTAAVESAVPQVVSDDNPSGPIDDGPTPLPPPWVVEDVDDPSAPRVKHSMGADSASAAGEVVRGEGDGSGKEPARELVTILPKRRTAEVPIVTAEGVEVGPELAAESATATAAAAREAEAAAAKAETEAEAKPEKKVEGVGKTRRPRTLPPPPAKPVTATDAPKPPPNQVGPRWPAIIVGGLAVALLTFMIVRASRSSKRTSRAGTPDASVLVAIVPDAGTALTPAADASEAAAPLDAAARPVDAGVPVDAAPRPVDAGVPTSTVDAGPDWRAKLAQSRSALDDGDAALSLQLADESLRMRTSARGHVARAEALRRLDRADDAIAAADKAISVTRSYAPAWYIKGQILWSVRRYDDARPVFETFLELQPTGASADNARELLGLPE